MSDPMDVYSKPVLIEETKLSKIFHLKRREKKEKPGRSLSVVFDKRYPLLEDFDYNYCYFVTFNKVNDSAGNHYHKKKEELFYPIVGEMAVVLEDIQTKERELINLDSGEHKVLYVPKGVAHKVVAKKERSILLVVATYPNSEEDEFPYQF